MAGLLTLVTALLADPLLTLAAGLLAVAVATEALGRERRLGELAFVLGGGYIAGRVVGQVILQQLLLLEVVPL